MADPTPSPPRPVKTGYNWLLLFVAGLGGLLYGIDVGIIAGAFPYLKATAHLNAGQLFRGSGIDLCQGRAMHWRTKNARK